MSSYTPKTFKKSGSRPITRVSRPFKQFMKNEAISGVLLITSVIIALIFFNSPLHEQFEHLWLIELGFVVSNFEFVKATHLWINEILMTFFFLLVGLEIKRELLIGELSSTKRALLPMIAAIGGMVVPAFLYFLINPPTTPGAHGWAIPMATDIAFALGILFLLGKRVPTSTRIFLTSLAIVDDIGAVLVIAFFYSEKIVINYVLFAIILILLLFGLNRLGINKTWPYLLVGIFLWYVILQSGLHATIAGVILAFTIPATTTIDFEEFRLISTSLVGQMNDAVDTLDLEGRHLKIYQNTIHTLEQACEDVSAPLQKLEHTLSPVVTFAIMPIFAIANAGVELDIPVGELVQSRIIMGIVVGLLIGKPLGIFGFTYMGDKLGIVEKPPQLNWIQILGTGFLGGIGFTMSIFISALAFPLALYPTGILIDLAKIGILISSTLAALLGVTLLLYGSNIRGQ